MKKLKKLSNFNYSEATKSFISVIIIFIISVVALFLTMHLSLFVDESFSMSLIHHSYSNIIALDSLDVHPPLYYIILKAIIDGCGILFKCSITTDVIIARLFSFLCIFLAFVIVACTLKAMHLKFNVSFLYLLLILLNLFLQITANIRMYPLTVLLISLEFFNLVEFIYSKHYIYLGLLTIFAVAAEYTHDYAALIAGLLILIMFIYDFIHKNKYKYSWLIAGIVFGLAYIPWAYISFIQATSLSSNYWISDFDVFRDSARLAIILLLGYPLIRLSKSKINHENNVIFNLLLQVGTTILILVLVLSIWRQVFILRYISSFLFIYLAVIDGLISTLVKDKQLPAFKNKSLKLILLAMLVIIGVNCIWVNVNAQNTFHQQSTILYKVFHHQKKRRLTHFNSNRVDLYDIHRLCQFNTYAQYKHIRLPKSELNKLAYHSSLSDGTSPKLIEKVWNTKQKR